MNFLAHFYLSGTDRDLLIGNFIADAVKGNSWREYPEPIQRGILLHRAIDHFTDRHETVLRSKQRLRPVYRHYAPVITDVFYDHFLAARWEQYHDIPLEQYARQVYELFNAVKAELPEKIRFMLPYMIRNNWLVAYSQVEGVDRVLKGMSRRTTFVSGMEHASGALTQDYELYQAEFDSFFPELQQHVVDFLK